MGTAQNVTCSSCFLTAEGSGTSALSQCHPEDSFSVQMYFYCWTCEPKDGTMLWAHSDVGLCFTPLVPFFHTLLSPSSFLHPLPPTVSSVHPSATSSFCLLHDFLCSVRVLHLFLRGLRTFTTTFSSPHVSLQVTTVLWWRAYMTTPPQWAEPRSQQPRAYWTSSVKWPSTGQEGGTTPRSNAAFSTTQFQLNPPRFSNRRVVFHHSSVRSRGVSVVVTATAA